MFLNRRAVKLMGTGIATLIAVCADKLHLANLVDAYAEKLYAIAFATRVECFTVPIAIVLGFSILSITICKGMTN